jgi:hypothetical protein
MERGNTAPHGIMGHGNTHHGNTHHGTMERGNTALWHYGTTRHHY